MEIQIDGPIIYIDDDEDNLLIFKLTIEKLGLSNDLRLFHDSQLFLDYLRETPEQPLLILCDLNMQGINGLELREYIESEEYLRQKAIPFLFYTTAASPVQVKRAYQHTIQGFMLKPMDLTAFEEQLNLLIRYWQNCLHPNSF